MSARPPGRRRAARRTASAPSAILAVVLVLLTAAAGLLSDQSGAGTGRTDAPAEAVRMTHAALACPPGSRAAGTVHLATAAEGPAQVSVTEVTGADRAGAEEEIPAGGIAVVERTDPVLVRGSGEAAPGLAALRWGGPGLRGLGCPEPRADQWFTGVAGDAEHGSVIELTNPDDGPAVVDLALLGEDGPVPAPRLRGLAVPAGEQVRVDLAQTVPRRDELALRVEVVRGRVITSVLDRLQPVGAGASSADWLPAQDAPAATNTLLGLAGGPGSRTLVVANPGESQVRVALQLLTATSLFVPADVEEIVVPPRSTAQVELGRLVAREVRDGAVGLVLTATGPVTATLTTMTGGDRSFAVPSAAVEQGTLLLPDGASRLLLTPEAELGAVTVRSWDRAGTQLPEARVELTGGAGAGLELDPAAARVRIVPDRGAVRAAVVTTSGAGAVVQPFREDLLDNLVPQVRPGLP